MSPNEYQELALRTQDNSLSVEMKILNGALGLTGESGEFADMLKKVHFQGHEFNREHAAKELGDIAWYIATTAAAMGYDLEVIFEMNIDKLKKRYPDGFDPNRSKNRKKGDV